jgi:trigger factor
MQVSVAATGPLERRLSIDVPEADIASQVATRMREVVRTAHIAGFRPGKAPLRVIERRFGQRVRQEVVSETVRASFLDAVRKENLRPAGDPVIDPLAAEPGRGLSYTATFEVYPEVSLAQLPGLTIEKLTCTITEADVDKMVESLRAQAREWEVVERAAVIGDRLVIDFHGAIEGVDFEGGQGSGTTLELGSGRFIAGFEQALVGASPGTHRELDLRFPDEYPRADLAGKPVRFTVDVKQVLAGRLPDLNEAFFKRYGVADGDLTAFRTEISRNMEREKAQRLRARLRDSVVRALTGAYNLELPKALVAAEADRLLQSFRQRIAMQTGGGAGGDKLSSDLFVEEARRRVSLGLVMGEIVRTNDLRADPNQVRARVEATASTYEDPAQVVQWFYEARERLAEIESAVLEDEAVDWLLAQAQVTERPTSFDALMNPGQTGNETQAQG